MFGSSGSEDENHFFDCFATDRTLTGHLVDIEATGMKSRVQASGSGEQGVGSNNSPFVAGAHVVTV